jgi:hypothetical protein
LRIIHYIGLKEETREREEGKLAWTVVFIHFPLLLYYQSPKTPPDVVGVARPLSGGKRLCYRDVLVGRSMYAWLIAGYSTMCCLPYAH